MIAPVKLLIGAGVSALGIGVGSGVLQTTGESSSSYANLTLLITAAAALVSAVFGGVVLLIKAWTDRQIALLNETNEKVGQALDKVTETLAETKVITGHVNSAATKADEARKAQELVAEATRVATEEKFAIFEKTIARMEATATLLAQNQATKDAVTSMMSSQIPQGVGQTAEANIAETAVNTAKTAVNTAKTDAAVQELKDVQK